MKKDIEKWFEEQRKLLSIEVKEVSLSEMSDWNMVMKDGKISHIAHSTGRFHRSIFLNAWDVGKQAWVERFLIAPIPEDEQPYYGILLLACYRDKYLIQAKSEPGNWGDGHVQITSTIHASYTNIKLQPGKINFIDMYNHPDCIKAISAQDGAQLYLKNNEVCFIELNEEPENIPENFIWATKDDILSFSKRGLVSEHIFQCLGIANLK